MGGYYLIADVVGNCGSNYDFKNDFQLQSI